VWIVLALAALAGCPRGRADAPSGEPVAEPAPVEIDWPDAGVRDR
jgi:hypothetical protein